MDFFIKHILTKNLIAYFIGYICIDLILRRETTTLWGIREYCVYTLSALWLFFLYGEIISRIKDKTANKIRRFPTLIFTILVTATISISYGFFIYFRILPNISAFGILYFSPRDFLGSIVSRISLLNALMFLIFFVVFYLFVYASARSASKRQRTLWEKTAIILLFIVSVPLFQNQTTITSGALLPEMNALFNLGIATYDELFDQENSGRRLPQTKRPELPALNRKAPCNILLILNESLRADHLSAFGYAKNTSPYLKALLQEEQGIAFSRFYAVSTRTIIALPSWITGISPVQPVAQLIKAPMFGTFAKQFQNQKTFLISSQPYEPGNVLPFLNDGSWDQFICAENSGHPFQPSTQSISDQFLPPYLDTFLDELKPNQTFFGIIHTFGTHHPYYADARSARLLGHITPEERYDAAIHTLDTHLHTIVDLLKKYHRFDNTIIISTSDHAEAMNEHGYWGHLRTFYNEEAHIPAWAIIPRKLREQPTFATMYANMQANSEHYLSNIDIMPTVLDILGLWDDPDTSTYRVPLLGSPCTRVIYGPRVIRMQNYQSVDKAMFPGTALLYGHYKYILLLENGQKKQALFDMATDPLEKHNIWAKAPQSLQEAITAELKKYRTSNDVFTYQPPSSWDTHSSGEH
ncbi:MAG: sulfatase [Desulfoplanes sp.]|nr:sulfatase [Desulfoplanes sp.]